MVCPRICLANPPTKAKGHTTEAAGNGIEF